MIYIETGTTDVYRNFGTELYFTTKKKLDDTVFLLWRTTPTLMLGKYQNPFEEINLEYAKSQNIFIVRRLSGGGTIYTDLGGWQFSFITKDLDGKISFDAYTKPVLNALKKLGIPAEFNGRNDIIVNGKKFSGNAQYKLDGMTVHHGSLLFDTDIDQMVKSTNVDPYKITSKSIKSVHDRVINLKTTIPYPITAEEFKNALIKEIVSPKNEYKITEEDQKEIDLLGEKEFKNWDKIYGVTPKFAVKNFNHFRGGKLSAELNIEKGKISAITLSGDFFSGGDVFALQNSLIGCEYNYESILKKLNDFGGDCIYGITAEEIAKTVMGR